MVLTMRLVKQPDYSSCCGQASVAIVAGITLKRSCEIFGHNHATFTWELVRALRKLKIKCAKRLKRHIAGRPLPPLCIAKVPIGETDRHWIVYSKKQGVLDPAEVIPRRYGSAMPYYVISTLEVDCNTVPRRVK